MIDHRTALESPNLGLTLDISSATIISNKTTIMFLPALDSVLNDMSEVTFSSKYQEKMSDNLPERRR